MATSPVRRINVVVIGETGSGKSTVINYITNYFRDGTFDRMKIAIPIVFYQSTESDCPYNEQKITDKTNSKTVGCNEYSFESIRDRGTHFSFIDTPGIGDTRGIQVDRQNINEIFHLIQQMGTLSALLLIINGTQPRLTFNVEYTLQQFRHWLPNVVLENVVVILTNCTQYTVNFEPTSIGLPPSVKTFYMQNSAFSNNPKKLNAESRRHLQNDWTQSMATLEQLVDFLRSLPSISTQAFIDMDSDKNELRSLLHESRLIIKDLQTLEDAFEMKTTQYQSRVMYIWAPVPHHNTLCSNCHTVCHERCALNEIKTEGDSTLAACVAFDVESKTCMKCPAKCHVMQHYHARKSIKPVDHATMETIVAGEKQKSLTSRAAIQKKLDDQLAELDKHAEHLVEACAEFNIVQELQQFVDYLDSDIKQLKSATAKRNAQDFLNKVVALCDRFSKPPKRSTIREEQQDTSRSSSSSVVSHAKSPEMKNSCKRKASSTRDDLQTNTSTAPKNESNVAASAVEMEIDEDFQNLEKEPHAPHEKQQPSKIDEFEDEINQYLQERTKKAQDVNEYHLLQLYRSMNAQEKRILLRGAEKLAGTVG